MTQHRPDLLPISKPTNIGLPYHGLVTDGVLDLGGGVTMNVGLTPNPGPSWIHSNPHLSHAIASTDQEVAEKRSWRTYAIWNNGRIGVTAITGCSYLYCGDEHANWGIAVTSARSNDLKQTTINLYLTRLFGYFRARGDPLSKSSSTLLATLTFDDLDEDGDPLAPFGITDGWGIMLSPKPDGTQCYINCYYLPRGIALTRIRKTYAVVLATVAGNGSLIEGSLGAGITGSLTLVGRLPDLYDREYAGNESDQRIGTISVNVDVDEAVSVSGYPNTYEHELVGDSETETYTIQYAFGKNGEALIWTRTTTHSSTYTEGWSVGSSLDADWEMYRYYYVTEEIQIKCNGAAVLSSGITNQLAQQCVASGTIDTRPGGYTVTIPGGGGIIDHCETVPTGLGYDRWDEVWNGNMFYVAFAWAGQSTAYHYVSLFNATLSFGSTDPDAYSVAYQPMTEEWASDATKAVCWV